MMLIGKDFNAHSLQHVRCYTRWDVLAWSSDTNTKLPSCYISMFQRTALKSKKRKSFSTWCDEKMRIFEHKPMLKTIQSFDRFHLAVWFYCCPSVTRVTTNEGNVRQIVAVIYKSEQWRIEGGGGRDVPPSPRNSEVLTKLNRIANWAENVQSSYSNILISLKIAEFRTPTPPRCSEKRQ
jgi:hypothetical protein